jgi:hypothetical protein
MKIFPLLFLLFFFSTLHLSAQGPFPEWVLTIDSLGNDRVRGMHVASDQLFFAEYGERRFWLGWAGYQFQITRSYDGDLSRSYVFFGEEAIHTEPDLFVGAGDDLLVSSYSYNTFDTLFDAAGEVDQLLWRTHTGWRYDNVTTYERWQQEVSTLGTLRLESLAVDEELNLYSLGKYGTHRPLDIDPGPGTNVLPYDSTLLIGSSSFLSKFDQEGNFEWAFVFDDSLENEHSTRTAMTVMADDNVLVSGGTNLIFGHTGLIFQILSPAGEEVFRDKLPAYPQDPLLKELHTGPDGAIYLFGVLRPEGSIDLRFGIQEEVILNETEDNLGFLVCYHPDLSLKWYQTFPYDPPRNQVTSATYLSTNEDQIFLCTPELNHEVPYPENAFDEVLYNHHLRLRAFQTEDGTPAWIQTYYGDKLSLLDTHVGASPDGDNLFISGTYRGDFDLLPASGEKPAYTERLDNGFLARLQLPAVPPLVAEASDLQGVHIFPNPTDDFLFINKGAQSNLMLTLLNLQGQQIRSLQSTDQVILLNLEDLSAGMYILQLKSEGKQETRKVFVR